MNIKKIKASINSSIENHLATVKKIYPLIDDIAEISKRIITCLNNEGKILWMGNGGSAADCQHLAAEFVGRFQIERKGLPAIALTTDTSILTSVSNDFGFETVFQRQIESLCKSDDVVVGISTSGNSANVISGLEMSNELGATTVGFTGQQKAPIDDIAKFCVKIPSTNTARIQEMHILCGHIICDIVEKSINER
ncbi:MAG TPA: D-sedoheptulose 7-phosphate isomerase [Balneolaceae bacterium]|nr:D-sedoheptulose 7-phosphate isomerase [Balneolaceae bacterium]